MAFEELKERQSVMWGNGPYQRITETIVDIHDIVLERLAPQDGDRFLDLACGTGAVAERAAATGADVTGIDLAPVLIETARERAESLGLAIDYQVGDAENLDVPDASFDKARIHVRGHVRARPRGGRRRARAGDEARRPDRTRQLDPHRRPGEDVRRDGAVPAGAAACSPFAWGDEARATELLGEAFELQLEEHVSTLRVPSGEAYWELFSTSYGPTKTLADNLGERREDLHRDWVEFFETNYRENGEIAHTREFLLVLGTRR